MRTLTSKNKGDSSLLKLLCTLFVLSIPAAEVQGQSHHMVVFTGNPTDFSADEKIAAATGDTDYYLTFDENHLYIGAFRTVGSFGVNDNLAVYIDTDPNAVPSAGTGTTVGQDYMNVSGTLPFSANYNVHVEQGYQEARSFISNWANPVIGLTYWTSTTAREVKIPFSAIGNPHALYITLWMGYNGGIFANAPGAAVVTSNNPTIAGYFGGIGISSTDCIPVKITNTPITDVLLNTAPTAGASYGKIIVDAGNVTANTTFSIAPGGSIVVSDGTLDASGSTVQMGGTIIGDGRGTTINTSGSGIFTTSATTQISFNGEGIIQGNALELNGLIGINKKFTPLPSGGLTMGGSGILDIRNGSYLHANTPNYASGSVLQYSTGTHYQRRAEWNANIGGTFGLPHHVRLTNTTTLNYPFESPGSLGVNGNLTIDPGSALYMDYGNVSSEGALTVMGSIHSGGSISLGTVIGNDLKVGGDITFTTGYSFDAKNRAVFFTKNGTQQITAPALSPPTFHYVVFQPSGGSTTVQLHTDLAITAPLAGNVVSFNSSDDIFDLNGRTLTLGTAAVNNTILGSGSFKGSTTAALTFRGNGSIGTIRFTSESQILGNLTVDRQDNTIAVTLGTPLTIDTSLTLNRGLMDLGAFDLSLNLAATATGGPTSYVIVDEDGSSGRLRKRVTLASNTFTFPIGDNTASANGSQYTPATVKFTAGTFSTAYMMVSVRDVKHSEMEASTDYLTRYWKLTSTGITGAAAYTFSGKYHATPTNHDVIGTESSSIPGRWNGTQWTEGSMPIGTIANTLEIAVADGATSSSVNELTAGFPLGAPEINVVGNNTTLSNGDTVPDTTDLTDFGNSPSTRSSTFLIQNSVGSKGNLKIDDVLISGANASDFNITTAPSSIVNPGGTTYLVIKFTPSGPGIRSAAVTIQNNDPDENPFTFHIQGQGIDYTECTFGTEETIAIQDFEDSPATPTWGYTVTVPTTALRTAGTAYGASGDGGNSNRFIGAKSLQVNNDTSEIILDMIDASQLSDVGLSMRIASFSNTSGNGLDDPDYVTLQISKDNGITWTDELSINGNNNSKWNFTSGTDIGTTVYDGNGTIEEALKPLGGGYRTSDGYSTLNITNLPLVNALKIKLTIVNNDPNEVWAIDNIVLKGKRKASKTWDGTVWSGDGNPPTASEKVLINGNLTLPYSLGGTEHTVLQGCECEVLSGTLTVGDEEGTTPASLRFQSVLKNLGGTIVLNNSSNLIQYDDAALNIGNARIKRTTQPVYRYDYTYWSSPLTVDSGFKLGNDPISLSPLTLFDKYFSWSHAIEPQDWNLIPYGNEVMNPGTGYIVRAPQDFDIEGQDGAAAEDYTANFIGTPNNGIVTHAVTGHPTDSKWNLLGNPYPSALNIETFLLNNGDYLDGTVYLWTHNTEILPAGSTGIYQYSPSDYASYNMTAGVGTKGTVANNPDNPSAIENNSSIPTGFLASGQAFFVKGVNTGTVTFNNSMRVTGNNSQFFKPSPTEPLNNYQVTSKHRIWLNLTGEDTFNQIAVGYIPNATNGLDWGYDGDHFGGNKAILYSLLGNNKLVIQGRALPFDQQDEVPLGYKTSLTDTLTISIDRHDGLFEEQDIYLEDQLLDIVHDLKTSVYSFATVPGTFNERFVLRYLPAEELGDHDQGALANRLIVYKNNGAIILKSEAAPLEQVTVYDLLGRTIYEKAGIHQHEFNIQNIALNQQPLIVKVKFSNGEIVNRKIVY